MFENIYDFFVNTIIKTCLDGFTTLYNFLTYRLPLYGAVQVVINVINFFGGTAPQWLIDLGESDLSILTIGGVALGAVLVVVIIKKLIPVA